MKTPSRWRAASDPTTTVEILGPPGVGKSALVSSLCGLSDEVLLVHTYFSLRNLAPRLRGAVALLPLLLTGPPKGGRSIKKRAWMIRLEASPLILKRTRPEASVLLFDQGPLYTIARMRELTPQLGEAARFQRWLQEKVSAWARALDVVILLDAQDEVLLKRIRGRPKKHLLKDYSESKARTSLMKDRRLYEGLIDELRSHEDVRVVRLDTSRKPAAQVAVDVMAALGLQTKAGRDGRKSALLSLPATGPSKESARE